VGASKPRGLNRTTTIRHLWFSPGTPTSSTIKTGRHDIAEILLKVAVNTKNQSIKSKFMNNACGRGTLALLIITLF